MITYMLAAFGLAYIVGHSAISLPIRLKLGGVPAKFVPAEKEGDQPKTIPAIPGAFGPAGDFLVVLLECPACFGFWLGIGAAYAGVTFPDFPAIPHVWPVMLGCLTAGINFILGRLTKLI